MMLCDLGSVEDTRHFVLECPRWQVITDTFPDEVRGIEDGSCRRLLMSQHGNLYVCVFEKMHRGLIWYAIS